MFLSILFNKEIIVDYQYNSVNERWEKEKEGDGITWRNIKYIILDHYHIADPTSKYSLDLLTAHRKKSILNKFNKNNTIYDYRSKKATTINCWECGLEIFVHNPVVSNTRSKGKKRYYHFKCALQKDFVQEKKPMDLDYHKFLMGLII